MLNIKVVLYIFLFSFKSIKYGETYEKEIAEEKQVLW